jgi:hypothetical protein
MSAYLFGARHALAPAGGRQRGRLGDCNVADRGDGVPSSERGSLIRHPDLPR